MVPNELNITIEGALKKSPDLKKAYAEDEETKYLIDMSRRLEGLPRHASMHAAGVVIGKDSIDEFVPLAKGADDAVTTQFTMTTIEELGLLKMDFLGLRTLTVIQDAVHLIEKREGKPFDINKIDTEDPKVYEMISQGRTEGVFQLESGGMKTFMKELKPESLEEIIAGISLYRPGPMDFIPRYVKGKVDKDSIRYDCPQLEKILKPTYGCIVYQEQVMQIAQIVAGYTLGGADLLRRAMGKKNAEAMAKERTLFVDGAVKNGTSKEKATEIFDLMEKFAEYGFNKSHSAAYALISYHTAYLKTHHKVEFMAALLTSEIGNQDKILKYIAACKDNDIEVRQPDVQVSRREFIVRDEAVVYGLGGIKNVGDEAIREIVAAREKDGPFLSFLDLCIRVSLRKVTKRVLESLIKGGALDCFGCSRAAMVAAIDPVVARAQKKIKEKQSNQISLLTLAPQEN